MPLPLRGALWTLGGRRGVGSLLLFSIIELRLEYRQSRPLPWWVALWSSLAWFTSYFENRSQCIRYDGLCSDIATVCKGVPQGSLLGPLLFTVYINNLGQNVLDTYFHFYADDTVIHCCASTLVQAIDLLQNAFNVVQNTLFNWNLFLKLMLVSKSRSRPQNIPSVVTLEGN